MSESTSRELNTLTRRPGQRPDPTKPAGVDLLPMINHIVVVMMENHSFDNYLGTLGRGDGLALGPDGQPSAALPDGRGARVRSFRMPTTCQLPDAPSQAWTASHVSLGAGDNGGFVRASGPVAMGYWTADDLPFYASLARTFPLCDRWFASCLGQTYPNRRFVMAGTAAGIVASDISSINEPLPAGGLIFERLDAHGISWANYATDLPQAFLFAQYATNHKKHLRTMPRFFSDARAGRLPAVSFVDPSATSGQSEENPADIRIGEAFVARVTHALLDGPSWPKTLMIWVYDEHGGYYDHVPPPAAVPPDAIPPRDTFGAFDTYGFRVPAVVVSPFARRHYVSHVVHDHTSILKLIETKWNLPALTYRDANADDLLDTLDLRHRPRFLEPPDLDAPALARASDAGCPSGPGTIPPADAITPALPA